MEDMGMVMDMDMDMDMANFSEERPWQRFKDAIVKVN